MTQSLNGSIERACSSSGRATGPYPVGCGFEPHRAHVLVGQQQATGPSTRQRGCDSRRGRQIEPVPGGPAAGRLALNQESGVRLPARQPAVGQAVQLARSWRETAGRRGERVRGRSVHGGTRPFQGRGAGSTSAGRFAWPVVQRQDGGLWIRRPRFDSSRASQRRYWDMHLLAVLREEWEAQVARRSKR